MFELPEYVTLAKQMNKTLIGKVVKRGTLGNTSIDLFGTTENMMSLDSTKRGCELLLAQNLFDSSKNS